MPSEREMPVPAAVTQFRWDYVMESGIRALPLELGTIGPYRPESIGLHLYDKMAPAMRMPRKIIILRKDQSMAFFFLA